MLTKEIHVGATLFIVGFIPFVFSKDAYTINKEILDMKEHAKALNEEHAKLVAMHEKLDQDCKNNMNQLRIKTTQLGEQAEQKTLELQSVVYEHGQAKIEERFSMDALNTAYTMRNKYALKVELYTQELEQLQHRKTTKLSERCLHMKPKFDQYGTKLTTRSLPGQPKASDRAEIIYLQNQLNQEKIIVTELMGKISTLKKKIDSTGKQCEKNLKDLQKVFAQKASHLNEVIQNIDVVKVDVKELHANSLLIQKQLKSVKEDGERLKAQSIALKAEIEKYFGDKECYKRIADLSIQYK